MRTFQNEFAALPVSTPFAVSILCKRDPTGALEKLAKLVQMPAAEAAQKVVTVIENANRSSHGGEFLNFDGTKLPW